MTEPPAAGPERKLNPVVETVVIVVIAVVFAFLIQWLIVRPYRIPSPSMVPTLKEGQRILVNRVTGRFGTPKRGDVVVFRSPPGAEDNPPRCGAADGEDYAPGLKYAARPVFTDEAERLGDSFMACPKANPGAETTFVKRVIGVPGDRLKIIRGHAYINGKPLVEAYVNPVDPCNDPTTCTFSREITIQPDQFFMMGDNRNNSDDSRFWGPIPKANVIGEAFATYWPPKEIGGL